MKEGAIDQAGLFNGRELTGTERRWVFWLSYALVLISWASIKMVLPALPGLASVFQSTPAGVKLSVSLYLIFFACSQPVWGGFVQRTGCRQTLFFSLGVTISGTLIVMFSFNLPMYILGRTLEGIGMGAASPLSRTILADVFERKELVSRIALVSGSAAAMPAVSPLIGGYLMTWISWRAIFGFFLLVAGAFFYLAFRRLPETHPRPADRRAVSTYSLLRTYLSILKNTHFWGYTLSYAALTGGLIGYYSAMPFWYHSQLGIREHIFSYLAIPTVGMYVIGLIFARLMVKKNELEEIFVLGMLLAFGAAGAALLLSILNVSRSASIVVVMSCFGFAAGLVAPTANAGILTKFKAQAGPTAALVAMGLFGSASLTSSVTMNLHIKNTLWPVAGYLGILSLIGLAAGHFWVWLPYRSGKNRGRR